MNDDRGMCSCKKCSKIVKLAPMTQLSVRLTSDIYPYFLMFYFVLLKTLGS